MFSIWGLIADVKCHGMGKIRSPEGRAVLRNVMFTQFLET
jgi:hypothetical protein